MHQATREATMQTKALDPFRVPERAFDCCLAGAYIGEDSKRIQFGRLNHRVQVFKSLPKCHLI